MNKITLPSGWMLRAWHHGASRDWRVQGTARGWLLTHGWPLPVSHSDGVAFFRLCEHFGLQTNTDDCSMARVARGELDDEWPSDKYPPCAEYRALLAKIEG